MGGHTAKKYHHPKKGQKSKTMRGKKDFTTKKTSKYFDRKKHRSKHAKGSKTQRRPYHKGGRKMKRTRKSVPWKGWGKLAPRGAERTRMYKKCGKKCFLGTKTPGDRKHPDFPICAKKTCKVNKKGLWAAYIRAKEWGNKKSSYKTSKPRMSRNYYAKIAKKAEGMLKRRGVKVGK